MVTNTDHYTKHTHEHMDKCVRTRKRSENVNACSVTYTQELEKWRYRFSKDSRDMGNLMHASIGTAT